MQSFKGYEVDKNLGTTTGPREMGSRYKLYVFRFSLWKNYIHLVIVNYCFMNMKTQITIGTIFFFSCMNIEASFVIEINVFMCVFFSIRTVFEYDVLFLGKNLCHLLLLSNHIMGRGNTYIIGY